jgi:hypothetical protein
MALAASCRACRCAAAAGILARRLDEPRRPPFECQPPCIRNAVTPSPAALAGTLGGLAPRSRKTGADEAGDSVTTDPMEEYKRFLGGPIGIGGEQL